IPMLLAVAAVHHELIRRGLRMRTSLIAETGEARDIHQFACLIGYGASAICPYLALQTLAADPHIVGNPHHRWAAYRTAVDAGLRKIMSKMGISTLSAYCGAQLFEAVGLDRTLVTQYFPGTPSRLDGIGLTELAAEALDRHRAALSTPHEALTEAGLVRLRRVARRAGAGGARDAGHRRQPDRRALEQRRRRRRSAALPGVLQQPHQADCLCAVWRHPGVHPVGG